VATGGHKAVGDRLRPQVRDGLPRCRATFETAAVNVDRLSLDAAESRQGGHA